MSTAALATFNDNALVVPLVAAPRRASTASVSAWLGCRASLWSLTPRRAPRPRCQEQTAWRAAMRFLSRAAPRRRCRPPTPATSEQDVVPGSAAGPPTRCAATTAMACACPDCPTAERAGRCRRQGAHVRPHEHRRPTHHRHRAPTGARKTGGVVAANTERTNSRICGSLHRSTDMPSNHSAQRQSASTNAASNMPDEHTASAPRNATETRRSSNSPRSTTRSTASLADSRSHPSRRRRSRSITSTTRRSSASSSPATSSRGEGAAQQEQQGREPGTIIKRPGNDSLWPIIPTQPDVEQRTIHHVTVLRQISHHADYAAASCAAGSPTSSQTLAMRSAESRSRPMSRSARGATRSMTAAQS